ncbi:RNA methyltransferase [Acinetobacter sp. AOR15_HL]|uniref:DNA methyltransferase n=1 Tax=unclassified Acinetobacter TaxID=196816 RepID=UPI0022EB5F61|nr:MULTISPECIES: DNA methyltransferase [unclassified Acinetobacter]MDA3558975.1 RNA methyltransferase [Acinetobacter sp. AOR15_HL]MDA3572434.1 RNA methyltransferase [Acinetobacter sp. AOR14_HL]
MSNLKLFEDINGNLINQLSVDEQLLNIDWSFANREKAHPIESLHPYPAKFIGELPRSLIRTFNNGLPVLDPFAGSGTTLMEAQRLGLEAVGIDLNPIACLITKVKTSATPENLLKHAEDIVTSAQGRSSDLELDIPNIDHWFKKDIQESIVVLLDEIQKFKDNEILFDVLRLSLSSILVKVSNQDSDTRYAAVEKNITSKDVFSSFINAVKKIHTALLARTWNLKDVQLIQSNTLEVKPEDFKKDVGMVVTSPPYPNAYEYWLYHKYRMWWLGFDPLKVKEKEIGARAHFFKKNAHTEENFWHQMNGTFDLIDNVLIDKGYTAFVIGRSKIKGKIIDNADIIQDVASQHGYTKTAQIERVIASKSKSFNPSYGNIKTETVLVLQKQK